MSPREKVRVLAKTYCLRGELVGLLSRYEVPDYTVTVHFSKDHVGGYRPSWKHLPRSLRVKHKVQDEA